MCLYYNIPLSPLLFLTKVNFSSLVNFFILASSIEALDLFLYFLEKIILTGLLAAVYLAPVLFPIPLCSAKRRIRSVVIPVYKLLSAHFRI